LFQINNFKLFNNININCSLNIYICKFFKILIEAEQTPSYNQLSYSELSKMVPPPPPGAPGTQPVLYPSQDPTYLGNIPAKKTRN